MKQETTLVSLAILSSRINRGSDYLDFFAPLVEYILKDYEKPVNSIDIAKLVNKEFGLSIPSETMELIITRLIKRRVLKRNDGVVLVHNISDKAISFLERKSEFKRKVSNLIHRLIDYSNKELNYQLDEQSATEILISFLSDFSYSFIGFVLGTCPLPNFEKIDSKGRTIISRFIMYLHEYDSATFEDLTIIAQGNMIANALIFPENLCQIGNFKNVRFYFDTPLLLNIMNLSGEALYESTKQLITLIKKLKGNIYCFSHSITETQVVINASAENYENGYGQVLVSAKGQKLRKADLILKAQRILELLRTENIEVEQTPPYKIQFQIDEKHIDDKLSFYTNKKAVENDINSIRSIYVLRAGEFVSDLKNCKAILVTSNRALVECANSCRIEQRDTSFPALITNFTLKNIAWLLNTPDSSVPKIEIIAYSYAATIPEKGFLSEIAKRAEEMKEQKTISQEDYQLLKVYEIQQAYADYTSLSDEIISTDSLSDFLTTYKAGIIAGEIKKRSIIEKENTTLKENERILQNRIDERFFSATAIGEKFSKWLIHFVRFLFVVGSIIWFVFSMVGAMYWSIFFSSIFFLSGLLGLIKSIEVWLIKKIRPIFTKLIFYYLTVKDLGRTERDTSIINND